ncbi:MAG: hypothetical protein HGB18_04350 [Candidatus Moranbacteria bacterium]|nr:hypothetical protein [Candidatus Moranbacteria bacterium]
MTNDIKERIALAMSAEKIVDLLGVDAASLDDQLLLTGKFADIVTKRLLLRVPEERTEEVRQALAVEGVTLESFLDTIRTLVPDFDRAFDEEMEWTAALFRGEAKER